MKVIDLLNKIANGEEVPKVIKIHNNKYEWKDKLNIYACGSGQLCFDYFIENNKLNDEVEIIEEDKKIEKITIRAELVGNIDNKLENLDINIMGVENKINEIIDEINKLKEGK